MAEEATKSGLAVLDPTAPPMPVNAKAAPRPDTLDGKVLGMLENNKRNGKELLDALQELLSQQFEFASVVRRGKKDVTSPCPQEIVDDLVAQSDIIITAIGD